MPIKVERNIHDAIILVVDDNSINTDILLSMLTSYGYKNCVAINLPLEAIEFCTKNPPDLIILDVIMPDINGHKLCRILKKIPGMENCPIIFSTTSNTPEDEISCWEAGGSDFVSKPVLPQTLVKRIESHLQLKLINDVKDELIIIDSLTGLRNRRFYDEVYRQQVNLALRNNEDFSIVALDIDYFKLYNDSYGHIAGDECLKKIALTLETNIHRPTDVVFRYGGEEFVMILPATDEAGARAVAQKIIASVHNLNLDHKESPFGVITISAGIACLKTSEGDSDLLTVADNKLYQANELGRNRYV